MKKTVSVCIIICLLLGMFSFSSFAATFAVGDYVELKNAGGGLTAANIQKVTKGTDFNINVDVKAKPDIVLNSGTKEVNAANVDSIVEFKKGTATLTYAKDLAKYFNVYGTIDSSGNISVSFSEKSDNSVTVYKVTSSIDTQTDTDVSGKLSAEPAVKYGLSSPSVAAKAATWISKLSSVKMGVRFFGSTYDNLDASEIAKVTAVVERMSGASNIVTSSVANEISDLMPGDRVTLCASLNNYEDNEFFGFYCWVDDAGNVLSTSNTIQYTADGSNGVFYAAFVELKDRFIIHVLQNENGSIEVEPQFGLFESNNQVSVLDGSDVTFRIIPNEGYDLAHLYIDGRTDALTANAGQILFDEQGAYSYTFKRVYTDHSIEAVFQPEEITHCAPHSFGEWKTVVAATCQTGGLERRICENCGLIQTRTTAKTMHQWEIVSVPRFFEGVSRSYKICALCGEETGFIDADTDISFLANGSFDAGSYWSVTSENELILTGTAQTDSYSAGTDVPWAEYRNAIQTVTIGHNIRSIGAYVLDSCPNLTDISYIGFEEEWAKIPVGTHNSALQSAALHFVHPKIYAQNISAGNIAGRKVRVSVLLENNPGIISTLIHVNYDTSKLRLVDVKSGAMLRMLEAEYSQDAFFTGKDLTATPYTSFWCADNLPSAYYQDLLTAYKGYPFDGTILTYTFEILDGAQSGVTPVEITYDDASTFNSDFEYVQFETVNGSINLIDCTPGDANGDGRISLMDTAMISRWVAGGYTVAIDEINADVNRDNVIDMKDVVLIKRYLAGGWGVVLY